MEWTDNELNIKCLLAKPIEINGIGVLKPLTIEEISEIGFDKYNQYLSLICVNSDDIAEMLDLDNDLIIEPFEFICENCKYNEDFKMNIISALSLFFREQVSFDVEMGSFFVGMEGVLYHGNYNFFVDLLKKMNCIKTDKDKNVKPKNKAQREFFKRLQKLKKEYEKYSDGKKEGNDQSDMSDIISAISAKHPSINLFNIKNFTIYQLIDQYQRIECIDQYFISIKSLLAGGDSKEIKINHWSSKLNKNNS